MDKIIDLVKVLISNFYKRVSTGNDYSRIIKITIANRANSTFLMDVYFHSLLEAAART